MCFRNLRDQEREFPPLRMWGTIGFILAQWSFEIIWLTPMKDATGAVPPAARGAAFFLSGAFGVLFAAYCLTLPKTPPVPSAVAKFAPTEALRLLSHRGFLVLFVISLPIAIVHNYHFVWIAPYLRHRAGIADEWIGRVTTVGQIFEIVVLATLGLILKRLGFKWTMCLGIVAYVLRAAVLALTPSTPIVVAVQALHGVCFACFFAAAFIYVDHLAPKDARASVQTFFNIFALGVGLFAGGLFAGIVGEWFTIREGEIDYFGLWLAAAGVALASLVVFAAAFPNRPVSEKTR
jgi:MFS family permease